MHCNVIAIRASEVTLTFLASFSPTDLWQVSKQLSEEYEKIVNPEKAAEDTKPVKIKEEPVSDITFPISEELEGDLASGDQSLPVGVLGVQSERFSANLEVEASPQTSGRGFLLLLEEALQQFHVILFLLVSFGFVSRDSYSCKVESQVPYKV